MDIQVELNQQEADRQARALAALLVDSPQTRKRIRKVIQKEIIKARNLTARDVKGILENDPRSAWKGVKYAIWKKALGGSVSILARRKAGAPRAYNPPRKLDRYPHQRGGNRVPRSARTEKLMTYYGADRGFVLRFLNNGTTDRRSRLGNRGSIAASNFFMASASTTLDIAAANIGRMIDEELAAAFAHEQQS